MKKKKALSILLCVAIILGTVPFMATAENNVSYFTKGDYAYAQCSDAVTNTPPVRETEAVTDTTSKKFGTKGADGRVWTDKSVSSNGDGTFDVTLSALSQEYESVITANESSSVGADVVFILDFTTSMSESINVDGSSKSTTTRMQALATAFNKAAKIIADANENNRIIVYGYNGGGKDNNGNLFLILDLAHYESTSGTFFTGASDGVSIVSSSGVTKDSKAFTMSKASTNSKTPSQYGIANGVNGLIKKINTEISDETKTIARQPFVIFMTDGAGTYANETWNNSDPTKLTGSGKTGDKSSCSVEVSALTTLTAVYWRDQLQAKYDSYNKSENRADNTRTYELNWFNIGTGVNKGTYPYVDALVDPDIIENTPSGYKGSASSLQSVRTKIESYDSSDTYTNMTCTVSKDWGDTEPAKGTTVTVELKRNGSSLSPKKTVTLSDDNDWTASFEDLPRNSGSTTYTYTVTEGSDTSGTGTLSYEVKADYVYADYADFCNTQEEVSGAFEKLAEIIKAASSETAYPVAHKSEGSGISGMRFTDQIGEGFTLGTVTLTGYKKKSATSSARVKATAVGTETSEGSGEYTFDGFEATAKYDSTTRKLVWNIPANEVGTYTYKDRAKLSEGNAYVSADPSTLSYTLTYSGDGSKTCYTNAYSGETAYTTAEYSILGDDYYYFENMQYKDGKYNGSTMISSFTNDKTEDATKATNANLTDTVSKVRAYSYNVDDDVAADTICDITVRLGNNGKIQPILKVEKTVDNEKPYPGDTLNYTITVKNLTDEKIENITLTDVNPVTGESRTVEIDSIAANGSETDTYSAVVPDDAAAGTKYEKDLPLFTKVEDTASTEVTAPGTATEAVSTVQPYYTVSYSWTSASGESLPAAINDRLPESDTKVKGGTEYDADKSFSTTYDVKDGEDVIGTWTFNGWDDDTKTVNSDTEFKGTWTYTEITRYKVTYEWKSADEDKSLPSELDGKLPENITGLLDKEDYNADGTYTSTSTVPVYKDGTKDIVIGTWTFSGWEDTVSGTTSGTIDKADGKFTGEWTYTPADTHSVTYEWNGPEPTDVTKPVDNNKYYENETYKIDNTVATDGSVYVIDDRGTKWKFEGWDTSDGTMGTEDVVVKGKWSPETPRSVSYTWTSGTEGKDLPAELNGKEPTDSNNYYSGSAYSADTKYDSTSTYTVYKSGTDNKVIEGVWTFSGWDDGNGMTSGTVAHSNIIFSGEWTYAAAGTYKVTYDWGTDVPEGVKLPGDITGLLDNEDYTADSTYTSTSTVPVYKDGTNDIVIGTWKFSGWKDSESGTTSGTIDNADGEFTGTWTYEPAETYNVIYDWNGHTPTVTKPVDSTDYYDGEDYKIDKTVAKDGTVYVIEPDGTKYIFSGWDKVDGTIDESDVTVYAQWTEESPKSVTYDWGEYTPTDVTKPTDDTKYYAGDDYTVDKTTKDIVQIDKDGNKWTFKCWDTSDGTMGTNDVKVTAIWEKESPKKATYRWEGEAPTAAVLPEDSTKYYSGDTADAIAPAKTEIIDENGVKWTFDKWDADSKAITDSDVEFVGKWNKEGAKKVTYDWGEFTPTDVTKPTDDTNYHTGEPYTIDKTTKDIVQIDNDGNKWTFKGWDTSDGTMGTDDVKVTAIWEKESPKKATYRWEGEAPTAAVLPEDGNNYYSGDTANAKAPEEITIIDGNGVKWTFDSWDANSKAITDSDVEFVGKWNKEEAKKVTYDWGEYTPKDVEKPTDDTNYHTGDSFEVDDTTKDIVQIGDDGNKWTFDGWDTPDGTIGESNVTIKAKWIKEEPKHVFYDWGTVYPDGVVLPTDDTDYFKGDKATSIAPAETTVIDSDNVKWTFSGWTPVDKTMETTDFTFTGAWTPEGAKRVIYNWGDFEPPVEIPEDKNFYHDGDTYTIIDPITPGTSYIDDEGNKWTFDGWDTPDGTIDGENVTVIAKWIKEEPKHVTYDWGTYVPADYRLPEDDRNYHTGDEYNAKDTDPVLAKDEAVEIKDEYDNVIERHVFKGWLPESGTIENEDVVLVAQWDNQTIDPPRHEITFKELNTEDEDEPKDSDTVKINGSYIRVYPNGGDWTYEETVYTADDMARLKVTEDMGIEDPTREGYTFTGWTVTEEDGEYTLVANWKEDINCNWIIPAIIIGGTAAGITGASIAGGTTAAVIGGIAVAIPVIYGVHKYIQNHQPDDPDEPEDPDNPDTPDQPDADEPADPDEPAPDTGSQSNIAVVISLILAIAAAFVILVDRKRRIAVK